MIINVRAWLKNTMLRAYRTRTYIVHANAYCTRERILYTRTYIVGTRARILYTHVRKLHEHESCANTYIWYTHVSCTNCTAHNSLGHNSRGTSQLRPLQYTHKERRQREKRSRQGESMTLLRDLAHGIFDLFESIVYRLSYGGLPHLRAVGLPAVNTHHN